MVNCVFLRTSEPSNYRELSPSEPIPNVYHFQKWNISHLNYIINVDEMILKMEGFVI